MESTKFTGTDQCLGNLGCSDPSTRLQLQVINKPVGVLVVIVIGYQGNRFV